MLTILEKALQQGAAGLSLGMMYDPGLYADVEEQRKLAQLCVKYNKPLTVHPRAESKVSMAYPQLFGRAHILRAFDELVEISMELGLDYLTLDRAASTLSTGERQRMQLARAVRNRTTGVLYVLDEPTISLHPLDVQTLLQVFRHLIENGATVIVIEHDLDVIRNADYVIDMGPGGGVRGGRIVAAGTPEQIAACPESLTGKYIKALR